MQSGAGRPDFRLLNLGIGRNEIRDCVKNEDLRDASSLELKAPR